MEQPKARGMSARTHAYTENKSDGGRERGTEREHETHSQRNSETERASEREGERAAKAGSAGAFRARGPSIHVNIDMYDMLCIHDIHTYIHTYIYFHYPG
jgi:hypothetical protein